jgi:hypothetical protein
MRSLTLSRFDPEPPDDPKRWQVGYDAVLEDGRELHSVTTVFRAQVPNGSREEILAIADAALLPGLILQDRRQPVDVKGLADAAVAARVAEAEAAAAARQEAVLSQRFDDIERYYFAAPDQEE